MKPFRVFFIIIILAAGTHLRAAAQDDISSMLDSLTDEAQTIQYVRAGFKTTRVINGHSFENTGGGVLDMKISHRFGFLSGGAYELFGLDQASIRIGLDYGITDWLMIGAGRSSFEKTYDGFVKLKFLRQSTGMRVMPITAVYLGTTALKTIKLNDDQVNYYSSRFFFTHQLIIGRKFSEGFSFQVMPTIVHRNLVETRGEKNDVFVIGAAARNKITRRLALNAEYYYVLQNQLLPEYRNSFSIGFDIETGGHVFQLHFTNSTSMIEKGFMTETVGNWVDGDIHFGFNVSRVFTIAKKNKVKDK